MQPKVENLRTPEIRTSLYRKSSSIVLPMPELNFFSAVPTSTYTKDSDFQFQSLGITLSSSVSPSLQSDPSSIHESTMSASATDTAFMNQAFSTLVTTLTPEEMNDFAAKLRAVATTQTKVLTPESTGELNGYGQSSVMLSAEDGVGQKKSATRGKERKMKMRRTKLRPLNAFMAFRCKSSLFMRKTPQSI